MKKIIKNKAYDTDTAQELGSWNNVSTEVDSISDFGYCKETLFKKRTGEYFLYGEGGARSKYAESAGQNSWTGGAMIIPLDFEHAQEWAETHLEADEYIKVFGEPTEGTAQLAITISASAKNALEVAAQKAGITQTELIDRLILENL